MFITAHIDDVCAFCQSPIVYTKDFLLANTCIWKFNTDKVLLASILRSNPIFELWFAKQEIILDGPRMPKQSVEIKDLGNFGFQTSLSERDLFRHRRKGLRSAISASFVQVSLA